ncbi:MAG: 3-oxoacyl-ACP synthase [Flavobacteriales bacterium]|nr:3-oxoacyl-ACP synthase [Flavobacteriales bacterium]
MSETLKIVSHSVIRNSSISVNGKMDFTSGEKDFKPFIKGAFRHYDLKYPKFFKMDNLCKLAMIGAEVVIKHSDLGNISKERIGIVLLNRASSLETDRAHQKTIDSRENYFPSPALFVYTLANIMAGEIAIKHKFQGENMSFVSSDFDAELTQNYVANLFATNKVEACLCGWVDFDEESYESVQYLVGVNKSKNTIFDNQTINEIYNAK